MNRDEVYNRLINIQEFLFSGRCLLCLDRVCRNTTLCSCCERDLPRNECNCRRCGKPLPVAVANCGECQRTPPAFDSVNTLYRYQAPIDHLVQQLKYKGKLYLARVFGEQLRDAAGDWVQSQGKPDLIVPVPLHRNRLRQRGFNQSIEIARASARLLGTPLEVQRIRRVRNTEPQTELPPHLRRFNVRGAFSVDCTLDGLSVALVDDVITTGNTVGELARELKLAGARQVRVWGIART